MKSQRLSAYGKMFFPTVDGSASYNNVTDNTVSSGVISSTYPDFPNGNQIDYEVKASLNVFNGFDDLFEVSSRSDQVHSYMQEYLNTKDEVTLEFVKAYIEIAKTTEMYLLAQDKLAEYKKLYQKELVKNESGLSSLSFVSNIKGKFRSTQLELYEKEKLLHDKKAQMEQFFAIKSDEEYFFPKLIKSVPTDDIEGAIETMITHNHIIKKMDYEISISKIEQHRNIKAFLPTVDLQAKQTWAYNYYDSPDNRQEKTYFGGDVAWGFNLMQDFSDYIGGMEAYDTKLEEKKKTILESTYKLKLKANQIKLEESKEEVLKFFIKARFDALTGTTYDFEFGKIDISIFLNSISEFFGAREKYISHRYDLLLAQYEFFNTLGVIDTLFNDNQSIIYEQITLDDERFFKKSTMDQQTTFEKGVIYVTRNDETPIYAKPSKQSQLVSYLSRGLECTSVDTKGRWVKMDQGWIYGDDLIDKYQKNRRYIAKVNVNARQNPNIDSKVMGWFLEGNELYSEDYLNGWIKTNRGWVFGENLELFIKPDVYYVVNASFLSIRTGPSLKYKVIGRYMDMNEVYPIKEKSGWVKTNRGWISKKYLIKVEDR
jgi:outer membrane protein TolC/uncharacterized protein YgiM (DUF1202 family)